MTRPALTIGLVRRGYSATGGAERYLGRFADALVAAGHRVVLFGSPEWPRDRWPHAFHPVSGDGPRAFADALEQFRPRDHCDFLFSLERIWRCDAYRAGDGVHRAWLARRAVHEPFWKTWAHRLRPLHRELLDLERAVYDPERTGRIIANARFVAEEITRLYGYPADRIAVVPNGLPPAQTSAPPPDRLAARRSLGLPADPYLALFLGSGWERKGLRFALRAAERLEGKVTVVVAGRGPTRGYRSARAHFAGPVADPAPWFAASDFLVLPTLYDPFSNACLEAAAAGLPVLTSAANGFSEVMTPGVHGEVVADPSDLKALARAMEGWCDRDRLTRARPLVRALGATLDIGTNVRRTLEALGLGPG